MSSGFSPSRRFKLELHRLQVTLAAEPKVAFHSCASPQHLHRSGKKQPTYFVFQTQFHLLVAVIVLGNPVDKWRGKLSTGALKSRLIDAVAALLPEDPRLRGARGSRRHLWLWPPNLPLSAAAIRAPAACRCHVNASDRDASAMSGQRCPPTFRPTFRF